MEHHCQMRKRLIYAISNTTSKPCSVCTFNQQPLSGLLSQFTPSGIILKHVKQFPSQPVQIPLNSFISLQFKGISLKKSDFKTDSQISRRKKDQFRRLQKWQGPEGPQQTMDFTSIGQFNQFQINQRKFGVKSTYDQKLYTTRKVDPSELTPAQKEWANKIAAEIGENYNSDSAREDEQAAYGAVLGTGRFQSSEVSTDNDAKAKYKQARKHLLSTNPKKAPPLITKDVESLNLMVSQPPHLDKNLMEAYQKFVKSKSIQPIISELNPTAHEFQIRNQPFQAVKNLSSVVELYLDSWKNSDRDFKTRTWNLHPFRMSSNYSVQKYLMAIQMSHLSIQEVIALVRVQTEQKESTQISKRIQARGGPWTGQINREQFVSRMRKSGVQLRNEQYQVVFQCFDSEGKVDFGRFAEAVRGRPNPVRQGMIDKAFRKFDKGNGFISTKDLRGMYNCSFHPRVQRGEITEDQALDEFLINFSRAGTEGIIQKEEWDQFYNNVSLSIDNDEHFVLLMKNA